MLRNKRILLVEDSDTDRFLFCRYLQQLGYECDCFENGKALVEKLDSYPSSLILMDIELPVMNGIETALHVRKNFTDDDRRFILIGLTSHNDPKVLDTIAASGFDNCIHKPIKRTDLENKLRQYISLPQSITTMTENSNTHQGSGRLYSLEMFESDDPDFLQSIIGMFVNNTPASISLIRESYTKSEWENLRVAAHKLKPHFNYFMIREAASALQEIEELARNVTDMEKIPALIDIVDRIGSQAIEQMKADHLS